MIIRVDKYVMNPGRFVAGTRGSYGVEKLDFAFGEEWEGLAVSVSFYPPGGEPVCMVYAGEPFNIPSEVMNVSGTSKFVVSGYSGEKVLITAEGLIRVLETSVPTENEALAPTPSQISQLMTALAGKESSVAGKVLSSNDFTDEEKAKLSGIESGAKANVRSDWGQTDSEAADFIKNKPVPDTLPAAGSGRGVTSGGVFTALSAKSDISHNHSGVYAPTAHDHSGTYAPSAHSHSSSYSAINHDHDSVYAPSVHSHSSSYSAINHNHDAAYAPSVHSHSSSYSALNHNHDSVYAPAAHTHNYAPSEHNHDSVYAPSSGRAAGLVAGAADNLSPTRAIEVSAILSARPTAGGESEAELAAAELTRLDGMSVVQLIENGNFSDASGWSAEGGNLTITGGVASFALDPPTLGGGIDSEADYATELGSSVELTGYDNGMQTCEASQPGIVEITELMSGDGWSLEGIALGTVTVTIWEDIDEVDSFTVEVVEASSGGPAETKVERAMSFVAGHKYYLEGEIKSPAAAPGVVIFADDGGALTHNVNSGSSGDWQRVSGIVTASATAEGKIGFKDLREVSATITQTGPLYPVGIIPETFARYIRAFSASASGNYRFIYNNGWKLNGTGAFVNFSYYGISADFNTGNESLRAGSTITVNFSYPYARIAAATLSTTGTINISGLAVAPSGFAGSLGRYAASGSYVFTYVSGTGWTFDGGTASVQLAAYGITGTVTGTPSSGAKITINLTITEEVIRMRRLAAYDLTQLGLESVSVADMERIIGGVYHGKGQTNAVAGGISSAGTAQNALDSGVTFTQNYELCRLPDGVSDTLDLAGGKLYRRITLKNVTGSSGAAVTLDGAKSGTAYLSAGGNIGSVVGTTLTLSKSVSGMSVYYELDSPQVTNISEPARYRVATGGTETLIKYDSAGSTYVKAPLGLPAAVTYDPDYTRQIESDRVKLLGLLAALGIISSSTPSVTAAASEISAALAAFIAAQ